MRERFVLLMIGTLLTMILVGSLTLDTWAPLIARFLIVSETAQRSDVIIIPSGTGDGGRIRYGVSLYRKGFAPKILLSGSSYLVEETGIDLMKVYALSLGVSEGDIWADHDSGSTVENALIAKEIANKNNFRSALVITSPTHSRRTKWSLTKFSQKRFL